MTRQRQQTRPVDATICARARADSAFRDGVLADALAAFTANDLPVAKILMRHYINATLGFAHLAEQMGKSPKSLMRMFSPSGNPTAQHLAAVFERVQAHNAIRLIVSVQQATDQPDQPPA